MGKSNQLLFYIAHWDISQPLFAHSCSMSLCAYRNMQSCPRQRAFHTKRGVKVKIESAPTLQHFSPGYYNCWRTDGLLWSSGNNFNRFMTLSVACKQMNNGHITFCAYAIFLKINQIKWWHGTIRFCTLALVNAMANTT